MSPSTRWNKSLPRKVNIFVWRLLLDRLSHHVNLSSSGLEIPSIVCPVCNTGVESSDHIFYACETAANVWRQVRIWCDVGLPCFFSNMDWTVWLDNWRVSNDRKDRLFVIIATSLWFLWRYRLVLKP